MLLTDENRRQYAEDGYTVARGLIPLDEIARLRKRLIQLLHGEHDWPLKHFQILDPSRFRNRSGGVVPFGVQHPSEEEQVFQDGADQPNLRRAMEDLLGGPVRRFTDQALIKNADIEGRSYYHQDSYYWRLDPERGCNAWIALDEVGRDASALGILPGTHLSRTLAVHEEYFDEPSLHDAVSGDAFKRWRIPDTELDYSREVVLRMSPGDAVFFTNFTWHRAEPNRSGQDKCAYAIAYVLEG